jgi:endonuclease/exonuclease/phosphatase family metal-dependent hydrolase
VRELRPDVVGLQEVDRAQPRSAGSTSPARWPRPLGAEHWRFVPALIGTPGWPVGVPPRTPTTTAPEPSYGIGLVSRYPVRSWEVVRLPAAPVRSPIVCPAPAS